MILVCTVVSINFLCGIRGLLSDTIWLANEKKAKLVKTKNRNDSIDNNQEINNFLRTYYPCAKPLRSITEISKEAKQYFSGLQFVHNNEDNINMSEVDKNFVNWSNLQEKNLFLTKHYTEGSLKKHVTLEKDYTVFFPSAQMCASILIEFMVGKLLKAPFKEVEIHQYSCGLGIIINILPFAFKKSGLSVANKFNKLTQNTFLFFLKVMLKNVGIQFLLKPLSIINAIFNSKNKINQIKKVLSFIFSFPCFCIKTKKTFIIIGYDFFCSALQIWLMWKISSLTYEKENQGDKIVATEQEEEQQSVYT